MGKQSALSSVKAKENEVAGITEKVEVKDNDGSDDDIGEDYSDNYDDDGFD